MDAHRVLMLSLVACMIFTTAEAGILDYLKPYWLWNNRALKNSVVFGSNKGGSGQGTSSGNNNNNGGSAVDCGPDGAVTTTGAEVKVSGHNGPVPTVNTGDAGGQASLLSGPPMHITGGGEGEGKVSVHSGPVPTAINGEAGGQVSVSIPVPTVTNGGAGEQASGYGGRVTTATTVKIHNNGGGLHVGGNINGNYGSGAQITNNYNNAGVNNNGGGDGDFSEADVTITTGIYEPYNPTGNYFSYETDTYNIIYNRPRVISKERRPSGKTTCQQTLYIFSKEVESGITFTIYSCHELKFKNPPTLYEVLMFGDLQSGFFVYTSTQRWLYLFHEGKWQEVLFSEATPSQELNKQEIESQIRKWEQFFEKKTNQERDIETKIGEVLNEYNAEIHNINEESLKINSELNARLNIDYRNFGTDNKRLNRMMSQINNERVQKQSLLVKRRREAAKKRDRKMNYLDSQREKMRTELDQEYLGIMSTISHE